MAKQKKCSSKARHSALAYAIVLALLLAALYGLTYAWTSFTINLATSVGQTTVTMIPKGIKMSTFTPSSEKEISVSSSTPQIAWFYDSDHHITDLAIYLPRDGLRKDYLQGHEFPDGSEYTSGRMLKLSNGRVLRLDFKDALIMEADLWMERNSEPEQGILIITAFSDVHLDEKQQACCETVFSASRDVNTLDDAVRWGSVLECLYPAGIITLAWLCLSTAYCLWAGSRGKFDEDDSDDAAEEPDEVIEANDVTVLDASGRVIKAGEDEKL